MNMLQDGYRVAVQLSEWGELWSSGDVVEIEPLCDIDEVLSEGQLVFCKIQPDNRLCLHKVLHRLFPRGAEPVHDRPP